MTIRPFETPQRWTRTVPIWSDLLDPSSNLGMTVEMHCMRREASAP